MEEESREKTRELYWNLVAQGDENDAVRIAGEYLNRPGELSEKVDALIRDWNEKGRRRSAIKFASHRQLHSWVADDCRMYRRMMQFRES